MKSVSFTGHRSVKNIDILRPALSETLENLIVSGAEDFYAGRAIGWDTFCADTVIELRRMYFQIKLHMVLPCPIKTQPYHFSEKQIYHSELILNMADSIEYVANDYYEGCMKSRNEMLIKYADCCVCYYNPKRFASGTGQTVRMAERKGIPIINIFDFIS